MYKLWTFIIIFLLMAMGCTKRKPIENNQFPFQPNKYDLEENRYELRNPDVEELLRLQNDNMELKIYTENNPIVDFTFFEKIHSLKSLVIGDRDNYSRVDLTFLKYVHNIEVLCLYIDSITVDGSLFRHLINLKTIDIDGKGKGSNIVNLKEILELPDLECLWLWLYYDKITIENISNISKLKALDIFAAEIDLKYINNFQQLNYLGLHSPKIINLPMLNNQKLEKLTFESFSNYDFYEEINMELLQNLINLKSLLVARFGVDDVRPLLNLSHLERVQFVDNIVDIMPLLESNSIKKILIDPHNDQNIQKNIFSERGIEVIEDARY
jgi:hypothetical protein